MTVSKRVRYEVLRRDNNTCRYCRATDAPLTIDHVTPVALGGSDDPSNLVAACKDCNAGKSSSNPDAPLVAEVADDAVRWASAMNEAWQRIQGDRQAASEELQPWFDYWLAASGNGWSYKLPNDVDDVLLKYRAAGMPVEVLIDAAEVAMRRPNIEGRFRYFQGVANNMLAEIQGVAAGLLSDATDEPASQCTHGRLCECFVKAWQNGFDDAFALHTVNWGFIQTRALSRCVDGKNPWNSRSRTWERP